MNLQAHMLHKQIKAFRARTTKVVSGSLESKKIYLLHLHHYGFSYLLDKGPILFYSKLFVHVQSSCSPQNLQLEY